MVRYELPTKNVGKSLESGSDSRQVHYAKNCLCLS